MPGYFYFLEPFCLKVSSGIIQFWVFHLQLVRKAPEMAKQKRDFRLGRTRAFEYFLSFQGSAIEWFAMVQIHLTAFTLFRKSCPSSKKRWSTLAADVYLHVFKTPSWNHSFGKSSEALGDALLKVKSVVAWVISPQGADRRCSNSRYSSCAAYI